MSSPATRHATRWTTSWPSPGTGEPTSIVREAAEYGGCLAAEVLGLPHAAVRTDSGSSSYADRFLVGPSLDANRAAVGLAADPDVVDAVPLPAAVVCPARHRRARRGRRRPRRTGSAPSCRPNGDDVSAWLDGPPDQPTVYATLGTVYNQAELLSMIIDGLAGEPLNLIVTVGPDQDPARHRSPPAQRQGGPVDPPALAVAAL